MNPTEHMMESLSRNVIIDLLPAYIAGEASEETRRLVEEFAARDPRIAELLRSDALHGTPIPSRITAPADLEMKTIQRVRGSIRRQMMYVALATASLLLVPLVAMQFTPEVQWSPFDFIVMGILLFGTGLTYVLLSRLSDSLAYRFGIGIAVLTGLFLIWVNLAVGIIGSEDHPANMLYVVVLFVGLLGAGFARFRARGMARTMFAVAIAQFLVPLVAFIVWRPVLDDPPGLAGVFLLNAGFSVMFTVSGLLFRAAAEKGDAPRPSR